MKAITLNDVIQKQCKNKHFNELFQRELLINEIAKLIIKLRREANLTQRELAIKAKTTQPVISRIESGKDNRIPSLELLTKIALATNSQIKIIIKRK